MAQPPIPPLPRFPTPPNPPVWDPDPGNNPWTPSSKVIGDLVDDGGVLNGAVKTLALSAPISIQPIEKQSDAAPDYHVSSDGIDLGKAWRRRTDTGTFLEVEIDDPSFHAPIRALLVPGIVGDRHFLIWGRL